MGNGPRAKNKKKKGKNNFSDLIKEEEEEEGPAVIDTQFFARPPQECLAKCSHSR